MARAVRFSAYGGIDVLQVIDVDRPVAGADQVLVQVRAASINPGEAAIRQGALRAQWPATFPSGEGSDLAGTVVEVGSEVTAFFAGDEVFGWTDERGSHAEFVAVPVAQLARKPAQLSWEQAGSLFVVGSTAWAMVQAVDLGPDDTVVVSGAAGGVGSLVVQLAVRTGATVIGLASEGHHAWLSERGVLPLSYVEGLNGRIQATAPDGVTAFLDTFGHGYVDRAIDLGVAPERINTIIDREAAARHGTKTDGSAAAARPEVLVELAGLIADGSLDLPIAATYPLEQVQDAYRQLELRHTHGKIVLLP